MTDGDVAAAPLMLVSGDVEGVIETLRKGALELGIRVVPSDVAPGAPVAERAVIVVVAVCAAVGQSLIARGLDAVRDRESQLAPDAIRVVVTVAGVAGRVPEKALRLLGSELQFQVESAALAVGTPGRWRSWRRRVGLATLAALGIEVFRVAPPA